MKTKWKKIIIKALCITMLVTLFGCKPCEHDWQLESNTATCTESGIKTFVCSICGETQTEESTAKGHSWNFLKLVDSTCTADGYRDWQCEYCGETIQDVIPAGHNFTNNGICSKCGDFKYNITLSITLPKTLKYYNSSHTYSKCKITDVHYKIQDGKLVVFFYGSKTYDENGNYGSWNVDFTCVLKNSKGDIISSNNIPIYGLIVGQTFGPDGYYSIELCDISYLSTNEKYTLVIVDRKI